MNLFIGGLPFASTDDDVRDLFTEAGFIPASVKVITDRESGKSRGFAFVEVEDGERAIQELDGAEFGGRRIQVNEARPQVRPDKREQQAGKRG